MIWMILAGVALTHAPAAESADTTFPAPPGARVEIENFAGDVVVRTWGKNEVRIVSSRPLRDCPRGGQNRGSAEPCAPSVRVSGSVVRIEGGTWLGQGGSRITDYEVTIPATAALRINGPYADVSVEGAGGDVTVETLRGDVRVKGGNGRIDLRSVQGAVSLEQARGRIALSAVNQGIRLSDVEGDITAEAVNGAVVLRRVRSSNVSASTINGEISYEGTLRDGGRYAFTTHNGDVVLTVPDGTNATFALATFNGEVESALPIRLTETHGGKRFSFTLGSGSARIELESFNGTIQLRRPGGGRNRTEN
jgi:DUF4097 and DUF4098 domain-containing protein YvlB